MIRLLWAALALALVLAGSSHAQPRDVRASCSRAATQTAGTFVLYGPNYKGALPSGITAIATPLDHSIMIFPADKYSNGVDRRADAQAFRASISRRTCATT